MYSVLSPLSGRSVAADDSIIRQLQRYFSYQCWTILYKQIVLTRNVLLTNSDVLYHGHWRLSMQRMKQLASLESSKELKYDGFLTFEGGEWADNFSRPNFLILLCTWRHGFAGTHNCSCWAIMQWLLFISTSRIDFNPVIQKLLQFTTITCRY